LLQPYVKHNGQLFAAESSTVDHFQSLTSHSLAMFATSKQVRPLTLRSRTVTAPLIPSRQQSQLDVKRWGTAGQPAVEWDCLRRVSSSASCWTHFEHANTSSRISSCGHTPVTVQSISTPEGNLNEVLPSRSHINHFTMLGVPKLCWPPHLRTTLDATRLPRVPTMLQSPVP
jgi:hypothetical protein